MFHKVAKISNIFRAALLTAVLLTSPRLFAALATKTESPEFLNVTKWFNTDENPSKKSLEGKIVLIDFWNPSSLRSIRRINVLKEWYMRYRLDDLEVIGVLLPEFEFEKNMDLVPQTLRKLKIDYPIAADNDGSLQQAYALSARNSAILIDHQGRIYQTYGETLDYEKAELSIQELLLQKNSDTSLPGEEDKFHFPTYDNFPDFYFGYKKMAGYGNDERFAAQTRQTFELPSQILSQRFYLNGSWQSKEESAEPAGPPASITILHTAQNIHIVTGSTSGSPVPVEIKIDGVSLGNTNKGKDVVLEGGKSYLFIEGYRMYEIITLPKKQGEYRLELFFEDGGAEVFKMCFG